MKNNSSPSSKLVVFIILSFFILAPIVIFIICTYISHIEWNQSQANVMGLFTTLCWIAAAVIIESLVSTAD